MERKLDPGARPLIGHCMRAGGRVSVGGGAGLEKPLLIDGGVRTGDKVRTGDDGSASIRFVDGAELTIGAESVFTIDQYAFEDDASDDGAVLTLLAGSFVVETGELAISADDFVVVAGDTSLNLRGARIAVMLNPVAYDMVTLLPPRAGPPGEVLAHNKIGMQVLARPCQTLRLSGGDADIPAPLTLPSNVVRETYQGAELERALFVGELAEGDEEMDGEYLPFRSMHDRFLERQFVTRAVFPNDGPARTGDGDTMLEDAFDGKRFRLVDTEPEIPD